MRWRQLRRGAQYRKALRTTILTNVMRFATNQRTTTVQTSFDPLDYLDLDTGDAAAVKLARKARDLFYKAHIATHGAGSAYRFALAGQLRKYESFGVPDGRVRTVYYVGTQS